MRSPARVICKAHLFRFVSQGLREALLILSSPLDSKYLFDNVLARVYTSLQTRQRLREKCSEESGPGKACLPGPAQAAGSESGYDCFQGPCQFEVMFMHLISKMHSLA